MDEALEKRIRTFPVKEHALNKEKLGDLVFDEACSYFEKTKQLFVDLMDLKYGQRLTPEEVNSIDNKASEFVNNHLARLESYIISQDNAKGLHDNITTEIKNFYTNLIRGYRPILTFLWRESELESTEVKDLQKVQNELISAKEEYAKIKSEFDARIKELDKKEQEVKSKHGKIAAVLLAKHFDVQCNQHDSEASDWLKKRGRYFKWIIAILVFNFSLYFVLFFLYKFGKITIQTRDIFTLEYGIMKVALLSILSYALAFCSKNYRVASNLKALNIHRRNVAQTLDDFLATEPEARTRDEMVRQGVEAMFKHLPLGYISNEEARDSGPINEIICKVPEVAVNSIKK